MLETEGAAEAESYSESHGNKKREEEDADAVEEGGGVDVLAVKP